MPRRRRPYRRFRRRRYGRNRRKKNWKLTIKRSPFPAVMPAKFKYNDTVTINPNIGSVAEHVFSANGLYDPDITGVGHQPRCFDQLIGTLYDHFVVVGSKITVRFDNNANAFPVVGMVKIQDSTLTTTSKLDWFEDSDTRKCNVSSNNGTGYGKITSKINIGKFLGRSKPLSDSELKGSVSTNPTEGAFWHVGVAAMDSVQDPAAVYCTVDIEYIAMLIEPRNPTAS